MGKSLLKIFIVGRKKKGILYFIRKKSMKKGEEKQQNCDIQNFSHLIRQKNKKE